MRERDVVKSNISDFIDEEQHKLFAACYSQKIVFQIWFLKKYFHCKLLGSKGRDRTFLTDPRTNSHTDHVHISSTNPNYICLNKIIKAGGGGHISLNLLVLSVLVRTVYHNNTEKYTMTHTSHHDILGL